MSGESLALKLAVTGALRRFDVGLAEPVRIGFLAPLSGPVQSWGLPGLMGCRLWVDWINRAGGLLIEGRRRPVELVEHDCGYDPAEAREEKAGGSWADVDPALLDEAATEPAALAG